MNDGYVPTPLASTAHARLSFGMGDGPDSNLRDSRQPGRTCGCTGPHGVRIRGVACAALPHHTDKLSPMKFKQLQNLKHIGIHNFHSQFPPTESLGWGATVFNHQTYNTWCCKPTTTTTKRKGVESCLCLHRHYAERNKCIPNVKQNWFSTGERAPSLFQRAPRCHCAAWHIPGPACVSAPYQTGACVQPLAYSTVACHLVLELSLPSWRLATLPVLLFLGSTPKRSL